MDRQSKEKLVEKVEQLENPFDKSKSGLNESAHNGFELAKRKILRLLKEEI